MKIIQPTTGGGGGGGGTVTQIDTQDSITGGPITGSGTINLVNDTATPGNSKYYGTDSGGTRGFFTLPSGGVTGSGANHEVTFWTGASTISGNAGFTFDPTAANYFQVSSNSGSSFILYDGAGNNSVWTQFGTGGGSLNQIFLYPNTKISLVSQNAGLQTYIDIPYNSGVKFGNQAQSYQFPRTYTDPTDNGKTFILNSLTGQLSWGSAGGSGITYGGAVTTGHDNEVLYINGSGNLASDLNFTRLASTNYDTFIGTSGGTASSALHINSVDGGSTTLGQTGGVLFPGAAGVAFGGATNNVMEAHIDANDGGANTVTFTVNPLLGPSWYNAATGKVTTLPLTFSHPSDNGKSLILDSSTGNTSWGTPTVTPGSITGPVTRIPYYDATTGALTDDADFYRDNANFNETIMVARNPSVFLSEMVLQTGGVTLNHSDNGDHNSGINANPISLETFYEDLSGGPGAAIQSRNIFDSTQNYSYYWDQATNLTSSIKSSLGVSILRVTDGASLDNNLTITSAASILGYSDGTFTGNFSTAPDGLGEITTAVVANHIAGGSTQIILNTGVGITFIQSGGTYRFPLADGSVGQAIVTDGAGHLSFATAGGAGWQLLGNASTNPTTDFVGTSDAVDLHIATNSVPTIFIDGTTQFVGIGAANTSDEPFSVDNLIHFENSNDLAFVGALAGSGNTGTSVAGFGQNTAQSNSGSNSAFFGGGAGFTNSGDNVVGIGEGAMVFNSGQYAIGVGQGAGNNSTGIASIFIGFSAGASNTFNNSVIIGKNSVATSDNQFVFGGSGADAIPNWLVNSVPWVMPASNTAGSLINDGAGNLSWGTPITVPGTFSGTTNQIGYFTSPTDLGGNNDFIYDITTKIFQVGFSAISNNHLKLDSGNGALEFRNTDNAIYNSIIASDSTQMEMKYADISGGSLYADVTLTPTTYTASAVSGLRTTSLSVTDQIISLNLSANSSITINDATQNFTLLTGDGTTFTDSILANSAGITTSFTDIGTGNISSVVNNASYSGIFWTESTQISQVVAQANQIAGSFLDLGSGRRTGFSAADQVLTLGMYTGTANGTKIVVDDIQKTTSFTSGMVFNRSLDSGTYTVNVQSYYSDVDTSAGIATVNLPAISTVANGQTFVISDFKGNAGANNITLTPNGADTIQYGANLVMATNYQSITIHADVSNGNWIIT